VLVLFLLIKVRFLSPPYSNCPGSTCLTHLGTEGVAYENKLGSEAKLAVPTPDHYLPLPYVIGTRTQSEPVTFPVEGVDGGSISMLTVQVGTALSGV
jgi:hypothetical protein